MKLTLTSLILLACLSVMGQTLKAGTGITISGNVISIDTTSAYVTKSHYTKGNTGTIYITKTVYRSVYKHNNGQVEYLTGFLFGLFAMTGIYYFNKYLLK